MRTVRSSLTRIANNLRHHASTVGDTETAETMEDDAGWLYYLSGFTDPQGDRELDDLVVAGLPPEREISRVMATYARLIGPLRSKAREMGYAIGVHGSLARDIDLIACPWSADAAPEPELADALRKSAEDACGTAILGWNMQGREHTLAGCPGGKPHGRLGWVFWCDGVPIDLSVMPRITGEKA